MMSHPPLAVIHRLCRLGTRRAQVANHREQRLLRLCEITHQRRPVVHLRIDVDGVFRIPGRIHLVVPYTLQIGRLTTWLRRRNQQVTTILHHQRHHIEVGAVKSRQALVSRKAWNTRITSTTSLTS